MSPSTARHAILTASDAKHGDFVIRHWLASLRANVDLTGIDVHVLDYGLNPTQLRTLSEQGVTCHACVRDGHITNIRYRDMARVLSQHDYDQVLQIDGGDIIFQADIAHLFQSHKDQFRGVCHEFEVPFHEVIMSRHDFERDRFQEMATFLLDKRTVNGGVLLGPAAKMKELWQRFQQCTSSFARFGIDQFLLNYILHRDGFHELPSKYNYSIIARSSRYSVRDGTFYDARGEVIPIVHNSGIYELTRPVGRFGFGQQYNRSRRVVPLILRTAYKAFNVLRHQRVAQKHGRPVGGNEAGAP